ncbi:MAG: prepilin peptidase [Methanolinea sp.]|nr:prepilin peptidase [Methanolinea sp.]
MIVPLAISACAITIVFLYASWRDFRERRVPFPTWYPLLAITIPMVLWFYGSAMAQGLWSTVATFVALTLLFSFIFYFFAYFNFFGGADAWALIFLSVGLPAFPWVPLAGIPPLGFLPFTVLVNALILNLFSPLILFFRNLAQGRTGPFPYIFLGFPVPAPELTRVFGFIMEDVTIGEDGELRRCFIRPGDAIRRMFSGEGRVYTRDLRFHPDKYKKEIEAYAKAGDVWISYGIPFLIPLTAGLISALVFGDILFFLIRSMAGV